MRPAVVVIETGIANVASVLAGLRRAGAEATLVRDPRAVIEAPQAVLPGVGLFGAARGHLEESELLDAA